MLHDPTSMVKTLDAINEKFLYGEAIPQNEALEAAQWISSQQGKKGSYRGLFAPTAFDFEQGMRVFTGERLVSASARHIMGQEAARAAWLLGHNDPMVREAYNLATGWMREGVEFRETGTFCCTRCTLAYWRHIWAGDFIDKEGAVQKGLDVMKDYRTEDGRWRTFPFFYAVYTLLELDLDRASEELIYARPAMERSFRISKGGMYGRRRQVIFEKALNRVS